MLIIRSWSLDRISLDLFSRSKVSLKFGSRSKLFFGSRSKVLIIFDCFGTRSKGLIMEFLAFKTFDLVIKIASSTFGTRSKVLIMVFLALKTFDLVPKKNVQILALDQKLKISQKYHNYNFWSSAKNYKTFDLVPKNRVKLIKLLIYCQKLH